MAVRTSFTAGEVLAAADLTDTFGAKLNLAGGKVLQVVRATDTGNRATNSTSFVDVTGMSVTITPQRSTSSILILAFYSGLANVFANSALQTILADSSNNSLTGLYYNLSLTTGNFLSAPAVILGYATPATTSAVTYKMRFRSSTGSTIVSVRNDEATGQMLAIEVSA